MSGERVAIRYAHAYIDALREKGALGDAPLFLEFCALVEGNSELSRVFGDVTIAAQAKDRIVKSLAAELKLSTWTTSFLSVLAQADRLKVLRQVGQAVAARLDALNNMQTVTLTTASPASDADMERFRVSMEKKLGSKIRIDAKQDPSLLGGAIARVGSVVYDGSVRAQLGRLRAQLVKEN